MDDLTRHRVSRLVQRHKANAELEIQNIRYLLDGMSLGYEPGVTLGHAERLAASAASLLRYVSTLSGIDDLSGLLGDDHE